jgi:hypothetical protein
MAGALPHFLGSPEPYPDCVPRLTAEVARRFTGRYLQELRRVSARASRVSDKLPGNFLYLGLIAVLFPRARVVHCRRDPLDTCLSIFFQNFGAGHPYSHDLAELGQYFRQYERLMEHWRSVLPVPMLEVWYEELVAEPEETTRRLLAHCALEWDPACLRFHESQRSVHTASHWQVRQPIYRTSAGRWRRYEPWLGPLKQAMGPD